jgi:hypothetical protein
MLLDNLGGLVEKFMQRNEGGTFHVPVCLFDLREEIYCIRQTGL